MAVMDHLVVTAATVEDGAAHIADALAIAPGPGGRHARMGTWNRLVGMGDAYLEAIAPDPEAPAQGRPRWFALDDPLPSPRLSHWALAVEGLDAALARHPAAGEALSFRRGDLRWRMAVPADGRLPWDGAFPALIAWEAGPPALPDLGARLRRLVLRHPDAEGLRAALDDLGADPRVAVESGAVALVAEVETADGLRVLR